MLGETDYDHRVVCCIDILTNGINRIISTYKPDKEDIFVHIISMFQSYPIAYKSLLETKPITCGVTGQVLDAVAAPDAVFIDVRGVHISVQLPLTFTA